MRQYIKKYLVKIIAWLDKEPYQVLRQKMPFWKKEMFFSPSIIFVFSLILIFVSSILEIGPVPSRLFGLFLFLTVSFVMVAIYFTKYVKDFSGDSDALVLAGILASISILMIEIMKTFNMASPFFIPLPGMIMLTCLLLGEQMGLIFTVVISFICGIVYGFGLEYSFYQFLGCLLTVTLSNKINHRQDIMSIGLKVSVINIFSIFILTLLGKIPANHLSGNLIASVSNGLLSALLVLALLSPLENLFSRITNIKLLELADFSRPLLKRLMLEAPGTYHHSLLVASIAEQAAKTVNANSLLVRVAALYHDIGKLIKPEYFIENQISADNPHDSILPTMSGLVVVSHVKEGVSFAKSFKLDKPIVDLIEQHHGTSLIKGFYQKAIEISGQVEKENFRYPGPKAKTKESAILTLADSCEAAVRVLENPNPGKIKDIVEKVINNKFTDSQLDDAPLSLADLHKIAESITTSLIGVYHTRIEYEQANAST